jgi:hypothetical protein
MSHGQLRVRTRPCRKRAQSAAALVKGQTCPSRLRSPCPHNCVIYVVGAATVALGISHRWSVLHAGGSQRLASYPTPLRRSRGSLTSLAYDATA